VSKHDTVLIIVMKCIILSAFVGGYIVYNAVSFHSIIPHNKVTTLVKAKNV